MANNTEKLATLGTQDEWQTIQRNWQHWIHKTQDEGKQSRETGNIGYTRRRQTIQRNWQHWIHKTQDEGKQIKNTTQHTLDTTMCKQTEIT
jgi:hypothetical protein